MRNNITNITIVLLTFMVLISQKSKAQEIEQDFQTRLGTEFSFKPLKKIKINVMPQFRFNESFQLSNYLMETEVEYNAFKFLEFDATYRLEVNPRDNKSTQYFNRFAFSAMFKKDWNRLGTTFRIKYSNYADDDVNDQNFIRFKASADYDIPKCKLTPSLGVEYYHSPDTNEAYKMRYNIGADYKLFKNNFINLSYKLDYYYTEYRNKNIVSLTYKLKF